MMGIAGAWGIGYVQVSSLGVGLTSQRGILFELGLA